MTEHDSILAEALAAVANGITHLDDLVEYCLDNTDLGRITEEENVWADDYLIFQLQESGRAKVTADFEVVRTDELAQGLIFTHRLTSDDIETGSVPMLPDLPILDFGTRNLSAPTGPITLEFDLDDTGQPSEGKWHGPSDWLSGFAPGELAAFRRQGDTVVVEPVAGVEPGDREAEAIAQAFDDHVGFESEVGEEPWVILEEAVVDDPHIFRRPVRPLTELLGEAGINLEGDFMGPADADWKPPGVAQAEQLRARLVSEYRLEECCEEALDSVIEAWTSFVLGRHPNLRLVNRALGHGAVAGAFGDWLDHKGIVGAEQVGEFLTALLSPRRRHVAPTRLLLGRHLEAAGDVLAAEEALEQAVIDDPEWPPALVELAAYKSDRGDAERAVALLRRAGADEDDPFFQFHASLGTEIPAVGRNDPCPCGSGRKYKQCHLGRPEIDTAQRVRWLMTKLASFTGRSDQRSSLIGLTVSAMWEDFEVEDLYEVMGHPFISELYLYEYGGVEEFLERRGPLLPDDERQALEAWAEAKLRLWEVVSADRAATLTLRDTGSGDTAEVTDRTAASAFRPGDQLLARVLPAWGKNWLSAGPVPIAPQHRPSLLPLLDSYTDADTWASWYGSLLAPPRLSNREGEPMVYISVTLRPRTTWDELEAVLNEAYERLDDEHTWQETLPLNEDERIIRAIVRRHGDELEVEVNSEERLERVLSVIEEVAEVVSTIKEPIETAADMTRFGGLPDAGDDSNVELTDDIVAEIRDRMEQRWLDEEIPALGGLTPRQAAADPTRREDLIALLRTFDRMGLDVAVTMRPDVLREALGLED